jgi:ring-1,2-phenylacetyl-CoA epoxidase subunit PaaD
VVSAPATTLEARVREALASVHDPEIPPCTIVDLGIVERVAVADGTVEVDLLPTFAGCPALDVIREDVEAALRLAAPDASVRVRFVHAPPWTSDRITAAGREALAGHGITPPSGGPVVIPLQALRRPSASVACPFCGSADTVLESAFGPTLCRSTHFCRSCRNPFEAFKPKIAAG